MSENTSLLRTLSGLAPLRGLRRKRAAHQPVDLDRLSRRILLPSMQITDEEIARGQFQDRGQKLARQEMWDRLSAEIVEADALRLSTPGGESAALLMAVGARGDVVAVAEDALHEGIAPPPDGIDALEAALAEHPDEYPCAMIVAMAHIDLGWAWRNAPQEHPDIDAATRADRFAAHFTRAAALLEGQRRGARDARDAPSLGAAQCALLAAAPHPRRRVADDYEALINLDPHSPRHMRALGQALLPSRFGSYEQLELEARRTAARTGDIWGAGAYAWVYFDALAVDHGAMTLLDTGFFIDGLRDILARKPDQHSANLLASFCAVSMRGPDAETPRKTARAAARQGGIAGKRDELRACLSWILADHLHELHPLIWTQALRAPGLTPPLPSRRALVREGRQAALRAIAAQFADQMADGSTIAFSPAGMYRLPSI